MNNAKSIRTEKSKLLVIEVKVGEFQRTGTKTAQLKQIETTTSTYQGKMPNDELTNSIYTNEDYGFADKDYDNDTELVCFVNVPASKTVEEVQADLAKFPKAEIYVILSNQPILTDRQRYSIRVGQKTLDSYANKQAVRYGKKSGQQGQLILDKNGKVQYRVTKFDSEGHKDIDERTSDPTDQYLSEQIAKELNIREFADEDEKVFTGELVSEDSQGQDA